MSRKMLIDAAHEEEVRVCVMENGKVEDFDFESAGRKPLRGNIYLARVTRVEPSLQAAFVEFGGNRHGFLAFGEIHPDYYQIPVSDRRLLQAAEDEEARLAAELELLDHGSDEDDPDSYVDLGDDEDGDDDFHEARGGDRADDDDEDDDRERKPAAPSGGRRRRRRPPAARADAFPEPTLVADLGDDDADSVAYTASEEDDEQVGDDLAVVADRGRDSEHAEHNDLDNAPDDDEDGDDAALRSAFEDRAFDDHGEVGEDEPDEDDFPVALGDADVNTDGVVAADDEDEEDDDDVEDEREDGDDENLAGEYASSDDADDDGDEDETEDDDGARATPLTPEEKAQRRARRAELLEAYKEARRQRARLIRNYKIQEVVKRRQILLVQVVKEERGNKGAALTTYLSLAGRYCVLMPNTARGGGISRKIPSASDRKRLRRVVDDLGVPKGMGLIIRTAGAKRTKIEIKRDFDYLTRLWENIRKLTLESIAPCLIYEEASLIKRAIRDLYDKDIAKIVVAGENGYREAKDFMKMLMPSHARNVQPYRERLPIFVRHDVETQLDAMYQPLVRLRSGGYLVIHQTEALIAIDVNSGKSTRERNIELTALRTNLEAAEEAARQFRLRDLAGLIVIDFIDMEENKNNRAVERRLKDALKADRARIQVGRISNFGLLELSRQRRRSGIVDGTTHACPACSGAGVVRSCEMAALRILRAIEGEAVSGRAGLITVKASLDVTLFILNFKRDWLKAIESENGVTVEIVADTSKVGDQFDLDKRGAPRPVSDERSVIRADTITTVTADDDPDDSIVEDDEEDDAEVAAEFEAENGGSRTAERKTAANGAGESGDDRPSRKRRRRRRRRRDGAEGADDDRPSQEASGDRTSGRSFDGDDSDDGDDDDATGNIDGDINGDDDISDGARTAEPIDSADGEDRPKRRRRGRRGGRRRRGQGEDAETPAVNGVDGDEAQGDYVSAADDEPYFGPDMGDDAEFEPERRDDLGVGSHAASADAGPVADLIYPADEGASAPRPTAKHAEAQSTDDPSDVSEGEARGGIGAAASAAPTADEIAERLKNRNPTRKGWWSRAFGG